MQPRFFFFLIVAALIIGAFWYFGLWDKTKDIFINFNKSDLKVESSQGGKTSDIVKNVTKTIVAIPEKVFTRATDAIKASLLESAKEEVGIAIDSAQQKFGLGLLTAPVNAFPLTMSLFSNKNKPLIFILEGAGVESSYSIDWGDGEKIAGKIGATEKKLLEHVWIANGSYLIKAEVTNQEKREFSFPILIAS